MKESKEEEKYQGEKEREKEERLEYALYRSRSIYSFYRIEVFIRICSIPRFVKSTNFELETPFFRLAQTTLVSFFKFYNFSFLFFLLLQVRETYNIDSIHSLLERTLLRCSPFIQDQVIQFSTLSSSWA